jgi:SPOR domain
MEPPLDGSVAQPTGCGASVPETGMSMADDNTLRRYRSNDPYRRAAEPPPPSEEASARDPLAELARLLGQSDPFADLGRSNSRERQEEPHDAPATAPEDWQSAPVREPHFAAGDMPRRSAHGTGRDYAQPPASEPAGWHADSRFYDEPQLRANQQSQHYDEQNQQYEQSQHYDDEQNQQYEQNQHYEDGGTDGGQSDAQEAEYAYQDDVPLEPHEHEVYDDAPRARRGGFATALALIGCAVLGTAGAYAYRSYFGNPSSTQPPPVITADNSTPTKIVPASAGDPQSSNLAQGRSASTDKERIVSKQEEPVALKEPGTQAAPRVVLPAPVAPGQGASASTEPKKVRTVVIHPDASDVSGKPVTSQPAAVQAAAAPRPTAPPAAPSAAPAAPKAATASAARNSGPISLEPQPSEPAAAPPARARTAAAPPPSTRSAPEATENTAGGFVVQLSSQKSEAEAQSSFRSLQAKFPNELGDLQPIIRRADLGSKGVFYRTLVGPFTSAQEASQFCATYKAAGGQCVVPNN